jgi:hypothetical protein
MVDTNIVELILFHCFKFLDLLNKLYPIIFILELCSKKIYKIINKIMYTDKKIGEMLNEKISMFRLSICL